MISLGNRIALYRKQQGLTQEALARQLEITNQAVSKWESDQSCPDITLLPRLADIFGISLDELFGREARCHVTSDELPWGDDDVLRAVLFVGRTLIDGHEAGREIRFSYDGPALSIQSSFSVTCDAVMGNVSAEGNVTCDDVGGAVRAGGQVICDDVGGDVIAGDSIYCSSVTGNVSAQRDVTCNEVAGSVTAGGDVYYDRITE